MENGELSRKLHAYIRDRAKIEKVSFDLPLAFFRGAVEHGVVSFFGVRIEDGEMVEDLQEPREGFMAEWLERVGSS